MASSVVASVAAAASAADSMVQDDATKKKKNQAKDVRYSFDEGKLGELRIDAPWTRDAKYLDSVAISPSAIIKIVS